MNLGFTAEESQLHSGVPPPCKRLALSHWKKLRRLLSADWVPERARACMHTHTHTHTHTHRRHFPNPGRTIHPLDASVFVFSALESGTFRGEVTGAQTVDTCSSRMWNSVNPQYMDH